MISHIKYTLIFDERVDAPELYQIFGKDVINNQQLLAEIVEEDKIGEVMAKNEDLRQDDHESLHSDDDNHKFIHITDL